jgi:hypothetical protein
MKQPNQQSGFAVRRGIDSRRNGFVLMLLITAIALMGAEMLVLSDIAHTVSFESDMAYLRAGERNLVASGLAWARRNVKSGRPEGLNETIELDVSSLGVDGASLSVIIEMPDDKEAVVNVETVCSRGRRTLRHSDKYRIKL